MSHDKLKRLIGLRSNLIRGRQIRLLIADAKGLLALNFCFNVENITAWLNGNVFIAD